MAILHLVPSCNKVAPAFDVADAALVVPHLLRLGAMLSPDGTEMTV
jgi:hypothetical protein